MGHTLTVELDDEDYAWLLEEARRTGLAPEQVAASHLARAALEREREQEFYRAGLKSGLFTPPRDRPAAGRKPFKTQPVVGTPVSETIVQERR